MKGRPGPASFQKKLHARHRLYRGSLYPPQKLAHFIEKFRNYLHTIGKEAGIYGHIGSGCMHIRPYIDHKKGGACPHATDSHAGHCSASSRACWRPSGEHGDGLIRSWLNPKMFGPAIYEAFLKLKTAFDPEFLMNPGKVVHGPPVTEDFAPFSRREIEEIPTFLDFSKEGGFSLAARPMQRQWAMPQKRNSDVPLLPSFWRRVSHHTGACPKSKGCDPRHTSAQRFD